MKVYHYARLGQMKAISSGVVDRQGQAHEPGLPAVSPVVWKIPEASTTKAVFGLLEPAPDSWTKNKEFPEVFPFLMKCTGDVLLEVSLESSRDGDVYVLEQAYMRALRRSDDHTYPNKFYQISIQASEQAYLDSRVPLAEYLEHPEQFSYSLPEVIFVHDVPLERLKVCDSQPKLEAKLATLAAGSPERASLIELIGQTPGLKPWWQNYQTTFASQPTSMVS